MICADHVGGECKPIALVREFDGCPLKRTATNTVFIDGNPDPSTIPVGMGKVNYFESYVGHHDRVGWFESFASPFPLASVQAVAARGSRPYIVWQPYDDSAGYWARGNQSLLPLINSGQYDSVIAGWATAAAANGSPMDISFGHEMNGNWFNWGYLPDNYYSSGAPALGPGDVNTAGHNGNSPQDYINAFRRVATIFQNVGATNVDFVWNVNADFVDDYTVAYPGDAFVDRMGMNGFNWGRQVRDPNNTQYDDWRDLEEVFGPWWLGGSSTYATLAGLSDKPIIIGEFGSAPEPVTLAFLALGSLVLVRRRR